MVSEYLKVTEDVNEMIEIAKLLIIDINKIFPLYTPLMMDKMREDVLNHLGDEKKTEDEIDNIVLRCIYDFWVYGCTVDEDFYLNLFDKTDAEKREYMLRQERHLYIQHLNWDAGPDRVEQLEDKYRLYKRLKPYYKRDVIEVRSANDLEQFANFVKKHKEFVVKPADFTFGIGVHKASMGEFDNNEQKALHAILQEGLAIKQRHPSRVTRMVLEELIIQDEALASLHKSSVNGIRVTAVRGKDGLIHIYHPWIKVGINGTFVASAALDGFDAEIDAETGIVISDGYQENGKSYKVHPDSGIQIKGFQIPKWDELIEFVHELMEELSSFGCIAWDLVLTSKGWCVMEGNYSGDFCFQFINNRGYKKDFEELIGWKYDKNYWWQSSERYSKL